MLRLLPLIDNDFYHPLHEDISTQKAKIPETSSNSFRSKSKPEIVESCFICHDYFALTVSCFLLVSPAKLMMMEIPNILNRS